jgi:hypothetical protein
MAHHRLTAASDYADVDGSDHRRPSVPLTRHMTKGARSRTSRRRGVVAGAVGTRLFWEHQGEATYRTGAAAPEVRCVPEAIG